MRRVAKNIVHAPVTLTPANLVNVIPNLLLQQNGHNFRKDIYGSPLVHGLLSTIYNGKCAFCETNVAAGSTLQVEHYRPKGGVQDDPAHSGYYWLGYEWTNLLLACSKCNRSKWNYFEIRGLNRAQAPLGPANTLLFPNCDINNDSLSGEIPSFLNPEVDLPNTHIVFSPSGKIYSRGSQRGDYTIEKCKLNRKPLRISRKKIIDMLLSKLTKYFSDYQNHNNQHTLMYSIKDRLTDVINIYIENQPYSMFARQIVTHFEHFVVRRFMRNEQKNILRQAYNDLMNQYRALI